MYHRASLSVTLMEYMLQKIVMAKQDILMQYDLHSVTLKNDISYSTVILFHNIIRRCHLIIIPNFERLS